MNIESMAGDLLNALQSAEKPVLSPKELETQSFQFASSIAEHTNSTWGELDKQDGYNCPKCRNKGDIWKAIRRMYINIPCWEAYPFPCSCMQARIAYRRNRTSGLPEGYTFDTFQTDEDWQRDMKRLCERYVNEKAWKDGKWLYIGGAIGSGKSHIVSALARELVFERDVVYMNWVRDARKLKDIVTDDIDYSTQLRKLWNADILFIDDFFKSGYITGADARLAYDILNERYNSRKPTLFTSELYLDEISDEALNGRIYERARDFTLEIERDKDKDMRRRT